MEGENFKPPHVDKIVGLPMEYKSHEEELQKYATSFFERDKKPIRGEIEKTARDLEIIGWVKDKLNDYAKRYGRESGFDVPLENIHILKEGGAKGFTNGRLEKGGHSTKYGGVLIDRPISDVEFALVLFHELLHSKSYSALQLVPSSKGEGLTLKDYRGGIKVMTRDGKNEYFGDLEEGVIGYLTEKFFNEDIQDLDLFKDDLDKIKESGVIIDISRQEEKEKMLSLAKEILDKNQDEFSNLEEVVGVFIDAQLNGRLLRLGKLIEKTFGKGSLRKLANETREKEE